MSNRVVNTEKQDSSTVHDIQLNILKEFKRVCELHGLQYFLWSDTLVGAVRHGQQIPWDNGLEVAMPRADYMKLKLIANTAFSYPLYFQTNEHNFFSGNISRLRNSNTTGVEIWDVEYECNWGIWIDIIALDFVFEEPEKRKRQLNKISFYQYLCLLQTYKNCFYGYQKLNRVQRLVYPKIAKLLPRKWVIKKFERACMCCKKGSYYLASFGRYTDMDNFRCLFFEDFKTTVTLDFETMDLPVPVGYERYLSMARGHYMDCPPEEKRYPRYQGIFNPDVPFAEIQSMLIKTFHNINDKFIFLWGTGTMFEDYMNRTGKKYRPYRLVDNDTTKWGKEKYGILIESPNAILEIPEKKRRVIICNKNFRQVEVQLRNMGVAEYYLYIQKAEWLSDILFPTVPVIPKIYTGGGYRTSRICYFVMKKGAKLSSNTGFLENGYSAYMSTPFFYKAECGSVIHLKNNEFTFAVATYSLDAQKAFNTGYREDENWSIFDNNYDINSFSQEDYIFSEEKYFRVCVRYVDYRDISKIDEIGINDIIQFSTFESKYVKKNCFIEEAEKVSDKINIKRDKNSLVIALLSDSHATVNGTWEDTLQNLKMVNERCGFDAIVHLGDFTDGILPLDITKKYTEDMIKALKEIPSPLYITVGNHDSNYFWYNKEPFTKKEEYDLFHRHSESYTIRENSSPWYYVDYNELKIRCIFLDSFENKEFDKYGFQEEEISWLHAVLQDADLNYYILVFSHVPPLDEIHCMKKRHKIRNGTKIIKELEEYDLQSGRKVLGYFFGHNHTDQVYGKCSFPIIGIGCNKCECGKVGALEGAFAPARKLQTVNQDLWDILIVTPKDKSIEMIRFGAGSDRTILRY